jgi:hypothetical protein
MTLTATGFWTMSRPIASGGGYHHDRQLDGAPVSSHRYAWRPCGADIERAPRPADQPRVRDSPMESEVNRPQFDRRLLQDAEQNAQLACEDRGAKTPAEGFCELLTAQGA